MMFRKIAFPLLSLSALLAAGCQRPQASPPPSIPAVVTVAVPVEQEVTDSAEFTGHTDAVESVALRARVTGYLEKVLFKEGSEVKKDDPLFEIDARPFQAELEQANATVVLREANSKFRASEVARNRPLAQKGVVTQADFEQLVAALDEAAAAVTAARAAARIPALNIGYTRIAAPIAGQISRAQVTPGNLVSADQTLLTTIVSVDPMYAYFDVDERALLEMRASVRAGKIKAQGDREVPVRLGLATDSGYPYAGVIDFAENRVDAGTGTIRIRAVFSNPKPDTGSRPLSPGLFVRLQIPLDASYKALVVAERALGIEQGQHYLLVVDDQNTVVYRTVEVGRLEHGMRVIRRGIAAGERVITSGLQRVRPGAVVEAKTVDMASLAEAAERKPAAPQ